MMESRCNSTKTGRVQVVHCTTCLSREEISPHRLLHLTRSYWGIETGLHHRKSVTLHEDHTRMTPKKPFVLWLASTTWSWGCSLEN